MATHHFNQDFQNMKQSFPSFLDIVSNMEIITNYPQQSFQDSGEFSLEKLPIIPGPGFPEIIVDTFPGVFGYEDRAIIPPTESVNHVQSNVPNGKKRKLVETPENSSANSPSPQCSGKMIRRENSSGKGKKGRNSEKEEKKEDGVVHVRARRGQATNSHSLAERVRRSKIKERLKCLQSIIPGCCKTMGMAVMLDEIINYVQSLHNQVDFLSMKLTAASTFQDFNSEEEHLMEQMQRARTYEAMKMQKIAIEGSEGAVFSSQECPFDLSFGCYPSLPYNK